MWRSLEKEKARRKKRTRTPRFAFFSSTAFAGRVGGEARTKSEKGGTTQGEREKNDSSSLLSQKSERTALFPQPDRCRSSQSSSLFFSYLFESRGGGVCSFELLKKKKETSSSNSLSRSLAFPLSPLPLCAAIAPPPPLPPSDDLSFCFFKGAKEWYLDEK